MYLSTGNVLVNPAVGMLFIDFESGHRTRLDGTASIDVEDPLRIDYPEAQFVVRVRARGLPELSPLHPPLRTGPPVTIRARRRRLTPVPEWKRTDWAVDALPENDPPAIPVSATYSDDEIGNRPCSLQLRDRGVNLRLAPSG